MGYITCWSCGKETEESDFFGNKNKNCMWCNEPLKKQPKSKKTINKQEEGKAKDVVEYHNNGKLKIQGTLDAYGKPHGNVKEWYSNGNISKDQNFKNGIHHGECKAYFENGNIWQEYNFKNGKQHGVNNQFYEDGSKNITCVFKDGKEHGMREQYYPSGNLENRTNYENGLIEGVYIYLKDNGEIIDEKIMQKGLDITMQLTQLMMENNAEHMLKAGLIKDGAQKFEIGERSQKTYEYYKSNNLRVDSAEVSALDELYKEGKIEKDFYDLSMTALGQGDLKDSPKINPKSVEESSLELEKLRQDAINRGDVSNFPSGDGGIFVILWFIGAIIFLLVYIFIWSNEDSKDLELRKQSNEKTQTVEEMMNEQMLEMMRGPDILSDEEEREILEQLLKEAIKEKRGEKFDPRIQELYIKQNITNDPIKKAAIVQELQRIIIEKRIVVE